MVPLADLPPAPEVPGPDHDTLLQRQMAFGYTLEDLKYILGPMGTNGEEAIGSMGTDTPLAVLSDRAQPLFNYFKQLFAQVTNPPLDAIREELVTSVFTGAGGEGNLLVPTPEACRQIALELPILDNDELARLKQLDGWRGFTAVTLPMLFPAAEGARGLEARAQVAHRAGVRGDRARGEPDRPLRPRRHRRDGADPVAAGVLGACIMRWSAGGCGPAPGWSSSAATRARSTTSPCSWAMAPARSTRTWPSRRSTT